MCNECLTKGLWHTEEVERLDQFMNGFLPKRNKKPTYRAQRPGNPATETAPPPEVQPSETTPRELPSLE